MPNPSTLAMEEEYNAPPTQVATPPALGFHTSKLIALAAARFYMARAEFEAADVPTDAQTEEAAVADANLEGLLIAAGLLK